MDKTVARLNIEHFQQLLAHEIDERRRQVLLRFLKEEEAKLDNSAPQESDWRPRDI